MCTAPRQSTARLLGAPPRAQEKQRAGAPPKSGRHTQASAQAAGSHAHMTSGRLLSCGSPVTRQHGELGWATGCGLSVTHGGMAGEKCFAVLDLNSRGCRLGAGPSELTSGCENSTSILRWLSVSHSNWLATRRGTPTCSQQEQTSQPDSQVFAVRRKEGDLSLQARPRGTIWRREKKTMFWHSCLGSKKGNSGGQGFGASV